MKKIFISIILIFLASLSFAQENISEIGAPSSPAIYMMGLEPSSILKPKTFEAFEASIFSNFVNSNGSAVIPNDFALEFSPYWARNNKLSIYDYITANFGQQIRRNSSFSLSSTQNYLYEDSTATQALSFGYRTTFFIRAKGSADSIKKQIADINRIQLGKVDIGTYIRKQLRRKFVKNKTELIDNTIEVATLRLLDLNESLGRPELTVSQIDSLELRFRNSSEDLDFSDSTSYQKSSHSLEIEFQYIFDDVLSKSLGDFSTDSIISRFNKELTGKEGFSIDFATGFLFNFEENNFESIIAPRFSIWLSPGYRWNSSDKLANNYLNIKSVFRYEYFNEDFFSNRFPTSKVYEHNFDFGGYIARESDKYDLNLEATLRVGLSQIETDFIGPISGNPLTETVSETKVKVVSSFVYRLNEKYSLTYSLGNRFNQGFNDGTNLISLLSLNVAFNQFSTDKIK